MGKIEEELAGARAAILEAGRRRSYIYTNRNPNYFIPSGSIYRNPYSFHQLVIKIKILSTSHH